MFGKENFAASFFVYKRAKIIGRKHKVPEAHGNGIINKKQIVHVPLYFLITLSLSVIGLKGTLFLNAFITRSVSIK